MKVIRSMILGALAVFIVAGAAMGQPKKVEPPKVVDPKEPSGKPKTKSAAMSGPYGNSLSNIEENKRAPNTTTGAKPPAPKKTGNPQ